MFQDDRVGHAQYHYRAKESRTRQRSMKVMARLSLLRRKLVSETRPPGKEFDDKLT